MTKPPCSITGCEHPNNARGLCSTHYKQAAANGTLDQYALRRKREMKQCEVGGCEIESLNLRRGMCAKHYSRTRVHGDPHAPVKEKGPRGAGTLVKGYRYVTVRGYQMAEHRHVMEEMLGRPLERHENVHHINGVKHDNRPENLELWSTSQPAGQRVADKIAWAQEILALYSSENTPGFGGVPVYSPPSPERPSNV